MDTDGFLHIGAAEQPADWRERVSKAAAFCEEAIRQGEQRGGAVEPINSERLQLKFARSLNALPPQLRYCVEVLQRHVFASCPGEYALQDCYALYSPADETSSVARAPQKWHLDAIRRFPVGALVLRGRRGTEFAAGPYVDFAAGVPDRTLDKWTASLKQINAETWESDSVEEWEHFSGVLHRAQLVTGRNELDEEECDWDALGIARAPSAAAGDASIFWSNKVHRGPGTDLGEERLVLFCSWLPVELQKSTRKSNYKESETDYSYYDSHLEPKLRLSGRAQRVLARQSLFRLDEPGAKRRRRGS